MDKDRVRKIGLSMATAAKRGDEAAVIKWATRALAEVLAEPEAEPAEPAVVPPNFGFSAKISSGLYGEWVTAWVQRSFPEAYRDWPPKVYSIAPDSIVAKAKEDGCLAQVCAAGTLGSPDGPWAGMGDWSLYTNFTNSNEHCVLWIMGEKRGEADVADGLAWAIGLGLDAG